MQSKCWVTKDRYYHLSLDVDLFGRLSVVKSWGARHNHLGGSETIPIQEQAEAVGIFELTEKQRLKRGYTEHSH